ncbi:MAG: ABC transporter substrate-binding protein [Anaerolineae bacterium]|nr:ABC transporter substrate-binding protein [Anaerolineae bacterium]
MRMTRVVVLLVVFGIVLASCAPAAPTVAPTTAPKAPTTIKIGALLPLTGSAAATGVKLKAAMEVAQEIINGTYPDLTIPLAKTAGLPNLGGAKIEIVFADHQGNPELAKTEAERLINQGMVGLVGAYQSSASKPASQAAEQAGVPFVCGSSSSAALTERGLKYFVRIAPNDDMATVMFLDYLMYLNEKFNANIKTIAVVYVDNEYGVHAKEMAEQWVKNKYGAHGFKIVGTVSYPVNVTNVDTEVQKVKAMNADAIFHASYIADITMFVKKYKEANVTAKAVMNYCGGFQDPQFTVNLGKDGDYFTGDAAFSAEKLATMPDLAAINKMYKAKTNVDLDGPALEEFASVMVLAEAINIAKSTKGDEVMKVIMSTKFNAPYFTTGAIKFNAKGQNEIPASFMVQTQSQKYQAVWPPDQATAKPVVPIPDWTKR